MDQYLPFLLPMRAPPEAILKACRQGVRADSVPPWREAPRVLAQAAPCPNEARRDADGRVLVTCHTALPGVTPDMIDWWFGWHAVETARYRLWHPEAHVASSAKEDRTSLPDARQRYVGNVSYADEYIGHTLKKLAIAFQPASDFGFPEDTFGRTTTICAATSDRVLKGHGGYLVHHVVRTADGAQMRSGFWLGEITHEFALVNRLAGRLLNTRAMRRLIVPDRMALDLLLHCAQEMNHLARFLPRLYATYGQEDLPRYAQSAFGRP